MDIALLGGWIGSALGILLAITGLFREKSRRHALVAERLLEQEKQESKIQDHLLTRMASVEKRIDTQAEHIATLTAENLELRRKDEEQARLIAGLRSDNDTLGRDNADLTVRVDALRTELDASKGREKSLANELAGLRRDLKPSHLTDRPPPTGMTKAPK